MDRSALRFVQTDDASKRLEFKDRLASRVQSPRTDTVDSPVKDEWFKVGDRVTYPGLGEGIITELNEGRNELILSFDDRDPVTLVFTQAKSWLSHLSQTNEFSDDCFIGDVIDREPLNRPDTAVHERVKSFKELPLTSGGMARPEPLQVNDRVWHPDFGQGEVVSLDKKEIVIEFGDLGSIPFSVEAIRSNLRVLSPDEDFREARIKQIPVRKEHKVIEPKSREVPELTVSLPEEFYGWRLHDQVGYLKLEKKFTIEQSNDIISVLNGKSPLNFKVILD